MIKTESGVKCTAKQKAAELISNKLYAAHLVSENDPEAWEQMTEKEREELHAQLEKLCSRFEKVLGKLKKRAA